MVKKITIVNKGTVAIHGLKPGKELSVDVDKDGVIIDKHWRRRVADNDEVIILTDASQKILAKLHGNKTKTGEDK